MLRAPSGRNVTIHCNGAAIAFWDVDSTFFTELSASLTLVDCRIFSAQWFDRDAGEFTGGSVVEPLTRLGISVQMQSGSDLNFVGGSFATNCAVRCLNPPELEPSY